MLKSRLPFGKAAFLWQAGEGSLPFTAGKEGEGTWHPGVWKTVCKVSGAARARAGGNASMKHSEGGEWSLMNLRVSPFSSVVSGGF